MTRQEISDEMKRLAGEMQRLTKKFDLKPEKEFKRDPTIMIDLPSGERGGGYPKFSGDEDLQRRWSAIATQLVKMIANPHISRDDINAVFNGIGMLGGLYVEKFKS
ncbi:MAG: hypothetical protein ACREOI_25070 [bacterium]